MHRSYFKPNEQQASICKWSISLVWIFNGLFCKILNLIPRHEQIVAEILGSKHSRGLTILIGLSEIVLAFLILSGLKTKITTYVQIAAVVCMNSIEFVMVPDLLLWGKLNALFAFLFTFVVFYNYKKNLSL